MTARAFRSLPGMLAILVALALATPSGALANHSQEMILQDDSQLIYSPPSHVEGVLAALKRMGVNRVRVSVVWSLVAPNSLSFKEPKFNATSPAAYAKGVWARWDLIDLYAHKIGLGVYFQPTAPAPYWATKPLPIPQGYQSASDINGRAYGQFVQAVATRYDGHHRGTGLNGKPTTLPAVRYWGIYNEPNIGGWMVPQWTLHGKKEASPTIYRGMLDAAWSALVKTGHRHDTVLIGETAAYGAGRKGFGDSMDPLVFIRGLYCLSNSYTPLKGRAATSIGCPKSGSRSSFVRANPGLFQAPGWAAHPYDFQHAPGVNRPDPNSATLSGLSKLERALDRSFRSYHQRAGIPIYITEWGVQSRGPSPFVIFSQAQQAAYINQGEYMAYENPRVRSFAQFLLVDDAPNASEPFGSKKYWATFQSGLLTYPNDKPKPAYYAFELPIWVAQPHHSSHVAVWAQIRSNYGVDGRVGTLQFRGKGSSAWTKVGTIRPTNPQGIETTHVSLHSAGQLRLQWVSQFGSVQDSRTVPIS
jgi:hypothetical protein